MSSIFSEKLLESAQKRRRLSRTVSLLILLSSLVSVATLVIIVGSLLYESSIFFRSVSIVEFLTGTKWTVLFEDKSFGVLPLLTATVLTSAIALLVAVPAGLSTAIYLSEYARPRVRSIVKPFIETLAGIPTVVYGYFALYFLSPNLIRQLFPGTGIHNALAVGLMIGVLIIPIVSSISEDAMYAVPDDLRLAAYAVGARKIDTVFRVVVPASLSGILASIVLAFSRAMGETMIAAIAGGFIAVLSLDPRDSMETMTAFIAQVATGDAPHGTIEYQSIFAVGILLFLVTMAMNLAAVKIVKRWGIKY